MLTNFFLLGKKTEGKLFFFHSFSFALSFSSFLFLLLFTLIISPLMLLTLSSSSVLYGEASLSAMNTTAFQLLPLSPSTVSEVDFCECGPHGVAFTGGAGVQAVWIGDPSSSPSSSAVGVSEEGTTAGIGVVTRPLILPFAETTRSNCHCQCSAGYLLPSCRYSADDPKVMLGLWLTPHGNNSAVCPLVSEDILFALCKVILASVTICSGQEGVNVSSACQQKYLSLMTFEYALPSDALHLHQNTSTPSCTAAVVQFVLTLPGWMAQAATAAAAVGLNLMFERSTMNENATRRCIRSSLCNSSLFLHFPCEEGKNSAMQEMGEGGRSSSFLLSSPSLPDSFSSRNCSLIGWRITDVEELTIIRPPPRPYRDLWLQLYWSNNISTEGGLPSWSIGATNCEWILLALLITAVLFFIEHDYLHYGSSKRIRKIEKLGH